MIPAAAGEEGTSKPSNGKKRKKEALTESSIKIDATVSASNAMPSPHTENEGDDDDDRPLEQRARWGADDPQATGHMVSEPVMVDIDLTRTEETLEEGSSAVPELQVRHGTVRVKKLYDHVFYKLQDELSCREKELENLTSKLNKSEASSTRKEEELGELRELLRNAQKEVAALSIAKAIAVEDASSYKKDAATANARAREISEKAEQKLAWDIAYARLRARRQALEEANAEKIDLLYEIEKARIIVERSTPSTTSDEDSGSDSNGSEGEE
ncbi:uncharacterized protein [Nicotiana sylvestris]|uniref:uncharacterized protein n=1 Tax=Nicotiana sylvestris TaxID=4096 RepID=UPI00388CD0D6